MQAPPALKWFVDKGLIHEVVRLMKSGKESHVYLAKRIKGNEAFYFVAKVHKSRATRFFKKEFEAIILLLSKEAYGRS